MSTRTTPMIEVAQVSKTYRYWSERPNSIKTLLVDLVRGRIRLGERKTLPVLQNISFSIGSGEFVGIMGRNGVGKSTLLKLISGIYQPTSGTIRCGGAIAPLIELGAGFHPELSGYENIFLNAAILGFGRKATETALPEILRFAELGEQIYMPIKNYSSGMLVRLGFSIATHLAAPILLVDEMLAVGDIQFQRKCLQKIEELHLAGRTIVLITHDPEAVRKHCSRCIVIVDREVVFDGAASMGADIYLRAMGSTPSVEPRV